MRPVVDYVFQETGTPQDPAVRVTKLLDGSAQSAYEMKFVGGAWRCNCLAHKFRRICRHIHFMLKVGRDETRLVSNWKADVIVNKVVAALYEGGTLRHTVSFLGRPDQYHTAQIFAVAPSYGEEKKPQYIVGFKEGLRVIVEVKYE